VTLNQHPANRSNPAEISRIGVIFLYYLLLFNSLILLLFKSQQPVYNFHILILMGDSGKSISGSRLPGPLMDKDQLTVTSPVKILIEALNPSTKQKTNIGFHRLP